MSKGKDIDRQSDKDRVRDEQKRDAERAERERPKKGK